MLLWGQVEEIKWKDKISAEEMLTRYVKQKFNQNGAKGRKQIGHVL